MTARQKIEWVTNSWYGFALFTAVLSIFKSGFGFFSLFFTLAGLAFSLGLTWVLGKLLLGRSSMTRLVLVVVSMLGSVFHALFIAWYGWRFLGSWSLGILLQAAFSGLCLMMHVRSFNMLSDKEVKSYIASK